jgi:hypothetical protein
LQQFEVITGRFAGAQEAGVRHHYRCGKITGEVATEQALRRAVGEGRPLGERLDLRACLDLRQLVGRGKGARRGVEHFAQLQLPGVEIEPP